MRLRERVAGELLDLIEDVVGDALIDARLVRAFEELRAHLDHLLRLLLRHGAAQEVGLAEGEAREALGHVHHLLLVEHDAVGAGQGFAQRIVGVDDGLLAVLAVDVVVHGARLQRARAVQGDQGDDVVDGVRLQAADQVLHAFGFELEDGRRLRGLQELVGGGIVEGQRLDVDGGFALFLARIRILIDGLHRPVDDGERLQAKEVELDEARLLHVVEVELRDHPAATLVRVERHVVGKLRRRDDDAAGVLAGVADDAFELVGHVHDLGRVLVAVDELAQLRLLGDRFLQGHADLERDHLGEPVREAERLVLHARHVAHHEARRHGAEGDDLAHRVVAVALRDMGDDALPAFHAEVDVEIRHGDALRVQEAFEDQAVAERIEVRDAEAEGHQRSRARAPAADRHEILPRPDHELLDDQEVAGEAHLVDDAELVVEALAVGGLVQHAAAGSEVRRQAAFRLAPQRGLQRRAGRYRIVGQVVGAEFDLAGAALGDLHRVGDRFGQIFEQGAHLRRRAHVLLFAVAAFASGVGENVAFLDADARLVRFEVLRVEKAHVVRGDHGHALAGGKIDSVHYVLVLAASTRAHDLKIDPVAERLAPGAQPGGRHVGRPRRDTHVARRAEQDDQAVRGVQDRLPRDAPMAVASIGVGRRDEPQQVGIAGRTRHQHDAAAGRAVRRVVVQVRADQRLDAGIATGRVELHQREQVHAIRQRHRRHVHRLRASGQILDLHQAVADRVLAVNGQVYERGGGISARCIAVGRDRDLVPGLVADRRGGRGDVHADATRDSEKSGSVDCRSPSPSISATGANERRCSGVGPKRRRLSRCAAVA